MNRIFIAFAFSAMAFSVPAAQVYLDDTSEFNIDGKASLRGVDQSAYDYGIRDYGMTESDPVETTGMKYDLLFRLNIHGSTQINDTTKLFARAEFDLNSDNTVDDGIHFRHAYVGFENDTVGKVWYGKDYGATYAGNSTDQYFYWGRSAEQGIWRIDDNLQWQKKLGDFTINASTTIEDKALDNTKDQFTGGGEAISLSYGASAYFEQGFGVSIGVHNARLGSGTGDFDTEQLYKEDGDLTYMYGMHYQTGGWHNGITIAKSELNDEYKDVLNEYTWEVLSKYHFTNGLYAGAGVGQDYGITTGMTGEYSNFMHENNNKANAIIGYWKGNIHIYGELRAVQDRDTQYAFALEYLF